MQELTKAEEQVMQVLWKRGPSFVKELLEDFPEPRPAVTTISTIVRILENKGVVGHEAFGRSHRYYALITKEEYTRYSLGEMVNQFFSGSAEQLVSFFVKEKKLSTRELDDILQLIESKRSKKK
jgi:BlaI family transcriptional regulator, penicillinase repressor